MPASFLGKLIDWKGFELFVAELYKNSDELTVRHNVTVIGKFGDKRQIDVLVTLTAQYHTLKIIIECKFWKDKVDRSVVDTVAAAVEDLDASKGVIFTTVGYEEGAVQYAKGKNIDIFLVRDVYEHEWGKPGRTLMFYMQMFSGMFENFSFKHGDFVTLDGLPPKQIIKFAFELKPEQVYDDAQLLYSFPEKKTGPNLLKLLIDVRQKVLQNLCSGFQAIFQPVDQPHELFYRTKVNLIFKDYPFAYLNLGNGYLRIEELSFNFLQNISQSQIKIDRAESADFILMVEDYISHQKHFVSKHKDEEKVRSQKVNDTVKTSNDEQPMVNGSIMKITTEYYVSFQVKPDSVIHPTSEVNVNLTVIPE